MAIASHAERFGRGGEVHGGRLGGLGQGSGWPGFQEAVSVMGRWQREQKGVQEARTMGCGEGGRAVGAEVAGGFQALFSAVVSSGC